jgi:hypothetical protein
MRALAHNARIARGGCPFEGNRSEEINFSGQPLYVKNVDSKADKIQLRNINKGFCKCFD